MLNFLDLFLSRTGLSSVDRGRVFLWLLYHYLEDDAGSNPFDDRYSVKHPGKAPLIRRLTQAEGKRENVDTQQEVQWGKIMSGQRHLFLRKLVSSMAEPERRPKAAAPHFVTGISHRIVLRAEIEWLTQVQNRAATRRGPTGSTKTCRGVGMSHPRRSTTMSPLCSRLHLQCRRPVSALSIRIATMY